MSNISIISPVDIAVARNILRKRIAGAEWTPTCRARAAAILTIFAEFILGAHTSGVISVSVLKRESATGVALRSSVKATGDHQTSIDEMRSRLARVTDDAAISLKGDYVTIDARVWTDGKVIAHG
jgi:hypothetical protein